MEHASPTPPSPTPSDIMDGVDLFQEADDIDVGPPQEEDDGTAVGVVVANDTLERSHVDVMNRPIEKPYMTGDDACADLVDIMLKHNCPKSVGDDMLKLLGRYANSVNYLLDSHANVVMDRHLPLSYRTLERHLDDKLPTILMDIDLVHLGDTDDEIRQFDMASVTEDSLLKLKGQSKFPAKFKNYKYKEYRVITYVSVKEALEKIWLQHGGDVDYTCPILFGVDGLPENDSRPISLEIVWISILKCHRHPLPVRIGRSPVRNTLIDYTELVTPVIEELNELNIRVIGFISDKPARSKVLKILDSASTKSCEICFFEGDMFLYSLSGQKNSAKRRKATYATRHEDVIQKTHASVRHIMDNYEDLDESEVHGYTGRSVLMDLNGFNLVEGLIIDYMHNGCLGVQKKLIMQTYNIECSSVKKHLLKHKKRLKETTYDKEARTLKTPSEFNRSVQRLQGGGMKAEELRNYTLCSSFAVTSKFSPIHPLIRIQLLWSFIVRAYVLPNDEWEVFCETHHMAEYDGYFQKLYLETFSPYHCVYNVHAASHMHVIRKLGPLTLFSLFAPEAMFHFIKMGIVPGTQSIAKQAFTRVYSRYLLRRHKCNKFVRYAPYIKGQKKDDSWAYTFDKETKVRKVWCIERVHDNRKTCTAREVDISSFEVPMPVVPGRKLDFGPVGVYKHRGFSERQEVFGFDEFQGKAMLVNGLLTLLPMNVLQESH